MVIFEIACGVVGLLWAAIAGADQVRRFRRRRALRAEAAALVEAAKPVAKPRTSGRHYARRQFASSDGLGDPWAGVTATGGFAQRRLEEMRARGITPSQYVNGER